MEKTTIKPRNESSVYRKGVDWRSGLYCGWFAGKGLYALEPYGQLRVAERIFYDLWSCCCGPEERTEAYPQAQSGLPGQLARISVKKKIGAPAQRGRRSIFMMASTTLLFFFMRSQQKEKDKAGSQYFASRLTDPNRFPSKSQRKHHC